MSNIIEVNALVKRYGTLRAVNGVNLTVGSGELFAFLGPNGAGKSTTIHILCTLLGIDSGSVTICGLQLGRDDARIRRQIGVVFQQNSLDERLTIRQNLLCRGGLYEKNHRRNLSNLDRIAAILQIENLLHRPFGKLSGGQKRRCEIARAMMHSPQILFLDEPTTGLDPQTREHVWEAIGELRRQQQTTVFLTTHYLEEAAQATHIAIIDEGNIAAYGTPAELQATFATDLLKVASQDRPKVEEILLEMNLPYETRDNIFHIRVSHSLKALQILKALEIHLVSFEVIHGTMNDVFLNITGKTLRED